MGHEGQIISILQLYFKNLPEKFLAIRLFRKFAWISQKDHVRQMWKVWLEMGGRLEMQIAPVSTTTFVFSPKTHFTFYLLSSWMRRWAISAAIYLSREEEASINTIINIKLRVVRGRFSIIFLKSYINIFFLDTIYWLKSLVLLVSNE